jgi:hypothetical protein
MEAYVWTMTILAGLKVAAKVHCAVTQKPVNISPTLNGWGALIQVGFLVWGAVLLSA